MRLYLVALVLLLVTYPSHACDELSHDTDWFVRHEILQPLPEKPFMDRNGTEHLFSELKGKPLLVHFWRSCCPPCIEELPSVDRLQKKLWSSGLLVVAINRDRGGPPLIDELYAKHDNNYLPVFTDRWGKLAHALKVAAVPITLYVDKEGREAVRYYGTNSWGSKQSPGHISRCLGITDERM